MKAVILADELVGAKICNWLFKYHNEDIGLVVVLRENEIKQAATIAYTYLMVD